MNTRLALAAALTLGLTFQPAVSGACGQGAQGARSMDRIAQAGTAGSSSESDISGGAPASEDKAGSQRNDNAQPRMKHPPTAQMDRATPSDKSKAPDGAKHPPTDSMDRATPDQKSPGSGTDENDKTPSPGIRT